MKKVRWIRLDIPYQSDGRKMRAVVGHSVDGERISTTVSDYSDNIPNILDALKNSFSGEGLHADDQTVLVYPLDGRMDLAWVVKEAADKEGWDFSRHIQTDFYPNIDVLCSFELDETGSDQDELPPREAQQLIFQLNNEAQGNYQSSDMPAAMSNLRQALQLSVKHFGWSSPGVAYSLTNFGHVMAATGNNDNINEVSKAVERMLMQWDNEEPDKQEWSGAGSILDQLIMSCNNLNQGHLSTRLQDYKEKLL